jgi:hypothetical protein
MIISNLEHVSSAINVEVAGALGVGYAPVAYSYGATGYNNYGYASYGPWGSRQVTGFTAFGYQGSGISYGGGFGGGFGGFGGGFGGFGGGFGGRGF